MLTFGSRDYLQKTRMLDVCCPAVIAPRFQPCRSRCYGALAAAGAASAEQLHPRHVGTHRRHLDPVVNHLRRLQFARPGSVAVRAIVETRIDNAVRIWLKRAGNTTTSLARRLVASLPIRLLALRRWQRRVVRRLARPLQLRQLRLKRGNARQRHLQLPNQRQQRTDQRVLLGMAQLADSPF